jgi:hypothetical protein
MNESEVSVLDKYDFIKLLEQYKNKALQNLNKESEVAAQLMITPEFHTLSEKCDELASHLNSVYERLESQFDGITAHNPIFKSAHLYYNTPTRSMEKRAVNSIAYVIRNKGEYQKKETEIKNKFDAAIRFAKRTKSAKKLLDLVKALEIEVDSIEVQGDVSQGVDVPFLKEKINSVKLLQA